MDLDIKDRLFLYNQYEILKGLNTERIKEYELKQSILTNGFKYDYDDELIGGFYDETPELVSEFVYDVLQMYRELDDSLSELSEEENQHIDKHDVTYAGFDGNEEGSYYTYANFVLKDLGRYEEIYNNGKAKLNSHTNMVNKYRRMVRTWKEVKSEECYNLSFENIKKIINDKYLFKETVK
ncbi:MAG TPA: YfbU family protein [Clostridium sp.]